MTENNLEVQDSKVRRFKPAAGSGATGQIEKETLDCDFLKANNQYRSKEILYGIDRTVA